MSYSQAVHNRLGLHFVHEESSRVSRNKATVAQDGNQHLPPPLLKGELACPGRHVSPFHVTLPKMDPLDSVSLATQVSQVKRLISQNCRVQSSAPPLPSFSRPPARPPACLLSRRRREPTLRCNSSGGQIENKFRSNFHTMVRRLLLIWPKTEAAQSRGSVYSSNPIVFPVPAYSGSGLSPPPFPPHSCSIIKHLLEQAQSTERKALQAIKPLPAGCAGLMNVFIEV